MVWVLLLYTKSSPCCPLCATANSHNWTSCFLFSSLLACFTIWPCFSVVYCCTLRFVSGHTLCVFFFFLLSYIVHCNSAFGPRFEIISYHIISYHRGTNGLWYKEQLLNSTAKTVHVRRLGKQYRFHRQDGSPCNAIPSIACVTCKRTNCGQILPQIPTK